MIVPSSNRCLIDIGFHVEYVSGDARVQKVASVEYRTLGSLRYIWRGNSANGGVGSFPVNTLVAIVHEHSRDVPGALQNHYRWDARGTSGVEGVLTLEDGVPPDDAAAHTIGAVTMPDVATSFAASGCNTVRKTAYNASSSRSVRARVQHAMSSLSGFFCQIFVRHEFHLVVNQARIWLILSEGYHHTPKRAVLFLQPHFFVLAYPWDYLLVFAWV